MTKESINVWSYLEEYYQEEDEIIEIIKNVFRSGRLILGENVSETYEGEYDVLDVWYKHSISRDILLDPKATHMGLSWYQDNKGKVWWVQEIGLLY